MTNYQIKNPGLLDVAIHHKTYHGFSQLWYPQFRQRSAGCGPTAAAMIIFYMTQSGRSALSDVDETDSTSVLTLMAKVWDYVTPGMFGLASTRKMQAGVQKYMNTVPIMVHGKRLDIKHKQDILPLRKFLVEAFQQDCPVAFLNLHRGAITAFEGWHWIVLTGIACNNQVHALDGGNKICFDLETWVNTTKLGGGFFYFTVNYDVCNNLRG
jgi:hypothetical protein